MRYITVSMVLLALACADDPVAPSPTLDGHWSGSTGGIEVHLVVSESGGLVTGCVAMELRPTTWTTVDVEGSLTGATLAIDARPGIDWRMAGELTDTRISGRSDGSEWMNTAISLTRGADVSCADLPDFVVP